jgi:hypothetical protein
MDQELKASLRDDLGLAIEEVMAVTPAPSLAAHVRARVDRERSRPAVWNMRPLAVLATLVVLIIVGAGLSLLLREAEPRGPRAIAARRLIAPVPYVAAAQSARVHIDVSTSSRGTKTPRVLSSSILSPQATALRDYVAYLRTPRTNDQSAAETPSPTQVLTLPAITLEPIAIDPLPQLDAVAGDRQ